MIALLPSAVCAWLSATSDFDLFLKEHGLTREDMLKAKARQPEPAALEPAAMNRLEVKRSGIEGEGLFAKQSFENGETIALAQVDGQWTIAGRYANHWPWPNAAMHRDRQSLTFIALRPIEKGQEITANYRQVAQILSAIPTETKP